MVVNVLIICMSVLVNIVGVATWAHKQIVPHISHIVPHHHCGSHCTDKFVPHDQRGSHYTNKPHFEESHCPTAQRRHCRWKKRAQYSTQGRHTLPEGTDLPKLPKRRLYISWIIRRQKGNPKALIWRLTRHISTMIGQMRVLWVIRVAPAKVYVTNGKTDTLCFFMYVSLSLPLF